MYAYVLAHSQLFTHVCVQAISRKKLGHLLSLGGEVEKGALVPVLQFPCKPLQVKVKSSQNFQLLTSNCTI